MKVDTTDQHRPKDVNRGDKRINGEDEFGNDVHIRLHTFTHVCIDYTTVIGQTESTIHYVALCFRR